MTYPKQEEDTFINRVYQLVDAGHNDAASDLIFDHVDRLLNDGRLENCNTILAQADPNHLKSFQRRSLLCITMPAKEQLSARAAFYDSCLRLLIQERGEAMARRLIGKLA